MSNIVAIVGRPNVGKSTLFNRLTGTRHAIVSEEAGTTRDRQYGKCEWGQREFSVIDTGGWVVGSDDIFDLFLLYGFGEGTFSFPAVMRKCCFLQPS